MKIELSGSSADRNSKASWWTPRLKGPVIAAAVVRLVVLTVLVVRCGVGALFSADTSSYLIPGRNLLLHGSFSADGVPDVFRTPGYPLFLAVTNLAGLPATIAATMLLSVLCVVLVWKLARTVFNDDRIAVGAAWIFAFEPGAVSVSFGLLSETLFLTLLLLSLERLAAFLRNQRLQVLAVAGLWLAAATFVRPVSYYFPCALALGLLITFARVPGLRWKAPAVLLISVLPWLAAWQTRNWLETGYRGFASITEMNLYYLAASDVTAHLEHRSSLDVSKEMGFGDFTNNSGQGYLFPSYLTLHPEQAGWSQTQRLAYLHAEAVRIIAAHPVVYLRTCFVALLKTVFYPSIYNLTRPRYLQAPTYSTVIARQGLAAWRLILARALAKPWIIAENLVGCLFLLWLYVSAVRGISRCKLRDARIWLLLGTSIYIIVLSALATGALPTPRLRLPIMPIVCIFAAAGLIRDKTIVR